MATELCFETAANFNIHLDSHGWQQASNWVAGLLSLRIALEVL